MGGALGRYRKAERPAPPPEPREPRGRRGHGAGLETAEGRRRRAARSVTSAPARPSGRSSAPLPRQPQRVRGGAREAGSRGPPRRGSPRPPTRVLTTRPQPRAQGPLEAAGGRRGRGTGGMGVPGPLAAADSSARLCPQPPPSPAGPRRHSGPKPRRDPASSPAEPWPAGAREPGKRSLAARRPPAPGCPRPPASSRAEGAREAREGDRAAQETLPQGGYPGPALTSASPPGRWQHCAGPPRLPDRGTRLTSARRGRMVGCPRKWAVQRERRS